MVFNLQKRTEYSGRMFTMFIIYLAVSLRDNIKTRVECREDNDNVEKIFTHITDNI